MTSAQKGHVYLVGAGPGDPELLTVRAASLIATADTILHDDLVPPSILDTAQTSALVMNVGKRCGAKSITQAQINALLIENARKGLSVVRLKSGDPSIFGRAAEEMDALRHASVPFQIVPGVTSALAAAAALRIALTDRRTSSSVQFATAHHALQPGEESKSIAFSNDATQVVYMPGKSYQALAAQWLRDGASPQLPCVIVSCVSQPEQKIEHTTLSALRFTKALDAPSLLIAGWTLYGDRRTSSSTSAE